MCLRLSSRAAKFKHDTSLMISLLTVFIERKENIWKKRRSLYAPATGAPVSHSLLKYSLFQFASLWRNKELDLPV